MFEELSTLDHPEVQAHLRHLRATYHYHMSNGATETILGVHRRRKSATPPATAANTIALKIPLTPELILAVKAAEKEGRRYIEAVVANPAPKTVR